MLHNCIPRIEIIVIRHVRMYLPPRRAAIAAIRHLVYRSIHQKRQYAAAKKGSLISCRRASTPRSRRGSGFLPAGNCAPANIARKTRTLTNRSKIFPVALFFSPRASLSLSLSLSRSHIVAGSSFEQSNRFQLLYRSTPHLAAPLRASVSSPTPSPSPSPSPSPLALRGAG